MLVRLPWPLCRLHLITRGCIYEGITKKIVVLGILGPMPPYGRQILTGSLGLDTVQTGTFWGVLNVSVCAFGTQL